jgi:hypothetical protein
MGCVAGWVECGWLCRLDDECMDSLILSWIESDVIVTLTNFATLRHTQVGGMF